MSTKSKKEKKLYDYSIIINEKPTGNTKKYTYHFFSSDIVIEIADKGGNISFKRTTKDNFDNFKKAKFFTESIKRFLFVYLINYNTFLEIKKITVTIADKKDDSFIYPYEPSFDVDKNVSIPDCLKSEAIINPILKDYGQSNLRLSSINNYLLAVNNPSVIEKFMHLWMAFNGLYGYLSQRIQDLLSPSGRISEQRELKWWGICNDLHIDFAFQNNFSHKKISNKVKNKICSIWKNDEITSINLMYQNDFFNQILDLLKNLYNAEQTRIFPNRIISDEDKTSNSIIDIVGFILLRTTYYARCNLFHGEKKILLFSKSKEEQNVYIRFANMLLTDYLTSTYENIFNDTFVTNSINNNEDKIRG